MGFFSWIIFGVIAGAIAKLLLPGKDPGGIIVTMLIGILGAFLGGFLFSLLGRDGDMSFNLGSMVVAVIGSIVLLLIYRMVANRAT